MKDDMDGLRLNRTARTIGAGIATVALVGAGVFGVSKLVDDEADTVIAIDAASSDQAFEAPDGQPSATESLQGRSDGPFDWARDPGADPTLDAILALQLYRPPTQRSGEEHLADVHLDLVALDGGPVDTGNPDYPEFSIRHLSAWRELDGSIAYLLFANNWADSDDLVGQCHAYLYGIVQPSGDGYVFNDMTFPDTATGFGTDDYGCGPIEPLELERLFEGTFQLSVHLDESVTLTSSSGEVALFVARQIPPTPAPPMTTHPPEPTTTLGPSD